VNLGAPRLLPLSLLCIRHTKGHPHTHMHIHLHAPPVAHTLERTTRCTYTCTHHPMHIHLHAPPVAHTLARTTRCACGAGSGACRAGLPARPGQAAEARMPAPHNDQLEAGAHQAGAGTECGLSLLLCRPGGRGQAHGGRCHMRLWGRAAAVKESLRT